MIEGMPAVVAHAQLLTLRDMTISARYRAIAVAYFRNCGKECAITRRSSQCACTMGGTTW